jgi:hypothetical protein
MALVAFLAFSRRASASSRVVSMSGPGGSSGAGSAGAVRCLQGCPLPVRLGHIQPAFRVDPAVGDAAGMRLLQVGFILEQELVLPERMVQPGRFEAAEIHPEDQILRFNFSTFLVHLSGAPGTGWRGAPGRRRWSAEGTRTGLLVVNDLICMTICERF